MPLSLEIVTAERVVHEEPAIDVLIAPGSEGQLAILPSHAPLMTTLDFGELVFRHGNEETSFAIGGGFLEVNRNHVTVLADVAELAESIDVTRAEAARARAEERLRRAQETQVSETDLARAAASMQRALLRLRVAERRRRRPGPPRPGG